MEGTNQHTFYGFNCSRPTIAIDYVHGSIHWKRIVEARRPGERVVFMGDYFDRSGNEPYADNDADNFREICAYAKSEPETILLVGNHDYHYMPFALWPQEPWDRTAQINQAIIMENIDLLKMVFIDDAAPKPVIFCHGGLCQTFMANCGIKSPAEINRAWLERPQIFDFVERNPLTGQLSDLFGEDPWQSPIWARLLALTSDGVKGFNQVVGHTPTRVLEAQTTFHNDLFLPVCTLNDSVIRLG